MYSYFYAIVPAHVMLALPYDVIMRFSAGCTDMQHSGTQPILLSTGNTIFAATCYSLA